MSSSLRLLWLLCISLVGTTSLYAQFPAADAPSVDLEATEKTRLAQALGDQSFSVREAATARILEIGISMLPFLKQVSEKEVDREFGQRCAILKQRIRRHHFDAQASLFLAHDLSPQSEFPGWGHAAKLLGDDRFTRELYVEVCRRYPELALSLQETGTVRVKQAQLAVKRIQFQTRLEGKRASDSVDLLAILLIAADREVPLRPSVEQTVITLASSEHLYADRFLHLHNPPFKQLLGRWIQRARPEHCKQILAISMKLGLREGRALALRTLQETKDVTTLLIAFQTMARFGLPADAFVVAPFLDDVRPGLPLQQFRNRPNNLLEVRVSDVALATIAKLHGQDLRKIGFPSSLDNGTYAFSIESLGFPISDSLSRIKIRKKIDKLLGVQPK